MRWLLNLPKEVRKLFAGEQKKSFLSYYPSWSLNGKQFYGRPDSFYGVRRPPVQGKITEVHREVGFLRFYANGNTRIPAFGFHIDWVEWEQQGDMLVIFIPSTGTFEIYGVLPIL